MPEDIDLPAVIAHAQQGKPEAVELLYTAYADPALLLRASGRH